MTRVPCLKLPPATSPAAAYFEGPLSNLRRKVRIEQEKTGRLSRQRECASHPAWRPSGVHPSLLFPSFYQQVHSQPAAGDLVPLAPIWLFQAGSRGSSALLPWWVFAALSTPAGARNDRANTARILLRGSASIFVPNNTDLICKNACATSAFSPA